MMLNQEGSPWVGVKRWPRTSLLAIVNLLSPKCRTISRSSMMDPDLRIVAFPVAESDLIP